MDKFFKEILEDNNVELEECNESQDKQINKVILKINNCLDGENKAASIYALIDRLSWIISDIDIDIKIQLKDLNKILLFYISRYQDIREKMEFFEEPSILSEQKTY